MVMKPKVNLRQLLFLSQEFYARLLNISMSLVALVESNRRILRGTPLARENTWYTQWKSIEESAVYEHPETPAKAEDARHYLDRLEAKLMYQKRKLEAEQADALEVKERARKAIHFYESRDGSQDTETESLIFGLGYRKARQELARLQPSILLELERKLHMVRCQLEWVGEKREA